MKILILPSWYSNSYNNLAGSFFKEQAEALAENGHEVSVISIQDIGLKLILNQKKFDFTLNVSKINGVQTYQVQYPAIIKNYNIVINFKLFLFKYQFKKYIKEHGLPDIIHLHSYQVGELAIWIKENYNIPYIVTEHLSYFNRNILSSKQLSIAEKVFTYSSYNIAVSEEFKTVLEKKFNLKFHYIPNMVNTKSFKNLEITKKYSFITVSFLTKNKNHLMLLNAIKKLINLKPKLSLLIVGDGPEKNNILNEIKKLNLEKNVFLYGKAKREELPFLLNQAKFFVLPSITETFGVVVIEAMSCGLPAVATKSGGPESIIVNDDLGRLCNIEINDLSNKLLESFEYTFDPENIRNYVQTNFSHEAICNKLKEIYTRVINEK